MGFCSSIARGPKRLDRHISECSPARNCAGLRDASLGLLQQENRHAPLTQSKFLCSERRSVTKIFFHSFASQKYWRTHNLSDAIFRLDSEEKEDVCKGVHLKRTVRCGYICHSSSFQVERYMLKTSYTYT